MFYCIKLPIRYISEVPNCEGLAIDAEAGLLYFSTYSTDSSHAAISVATVNGNYRRTIVDSDIVPSLKKPRGLTLDIAEG